MPRVPSTRRRSPLRIFVVAPATLTPIATLTSPIALATRTGSTHLFVAERGGLVRELAVTGDTATVTTLLDISGYVSLSEGGGLLDEVLELAHVAREAVRLQRGQRVGAVGAHDEHGVGVVLLALAHLLDAIQAFEQRHGQDALRCLPVVLLQLSSDQEVEFLVGAAEFHVRFHRHRVISLAQRIQQLVNGDRLSVSVALGEIIALEHPCDGMQSRQANQTRRTQRIEPDGIEADLGPAGIENLEYLLLVSPGVFDDLLSRQRRPSRVLAGGITDHPGKVANQEQHMMTKVLTVPELVDQYGMPEMQIRRCRIKTRLDPERSAGFQPFKKFGFNQQFFCPALDLLEFFFNDAHAAPFSPT